jgi:hypothetical protein
MKKFLESSDCKALNSSDSKGKLAKKTDKVVRQGHWSTGMTSRSRCKEPRFLNTQPPKVE